MALRACAGQAWNASAVLLLNSRASRSVPIPQRVVCFIKAWPGNAKRLAGSRLGSAAYFGSTPQLRSAGHTSRKPVTKSWGPVARIKRRKDPPLDNVIQREKKLKIVSRIKDLLVKQPGRVMSLRDLGKHRKYIGLTGKRRCVALLNKFPAVFKVFEEGCNVFYFRLMPEVEKFYEEELQIREELEIVAVEKLRKLLMMSIDKRILLAKIAHVKRDLGLSDDYRFTTVPKYPQYFKVVETGDGPALELVEWDPTLAVTAWEKRRANEEALKSSEECAPERPSKFRKVDLPKGYSLSRKDKELIMKFQDMPFVSPYEDPSHLNPASPEAEKRSVAVVHEVLSLTLEKRLLIDHLTHFRHDFKFSQRVHPMLIRHPEVFYVSLKGTRDCVFLREAYSGSQLLEKDPLVLAKERLGELVTIGRKEMQARRAGRADGNEEEEDEDDEGEDFDVSDGDEDEDEDYDSEGEDRAAAEFKAKDEAMRDQRDLALASSQAQRVRERW